MSNTTEEDSKHPLMCVKASLKTSQLTVTQKQNNLSDQITGNLAPKPHKQTQDSIYRKRYKYWGNINLFI